MSRWFRLDDDVINDPKILLLPEALRWIWIAFLCIASKNSGMLPKIEVVALGLRVKPSKAAEYLTRLVTAGLIDNNDGVFSPHNWNGRQYKTDVTDETAAERMRRYRDRQRNDRNAAVTVTRTREQITEADTETDQGKRTRARALAEPWTDADRERFWAEFPNKIGKADAMKAFDKASHKTGPDVLFPALQRYARKTDDRPFCNPSTWLNQERWLDQPVTSTNGNQHRGANGNRSTNADFFAGIASVAADIDGDGPPPGPADPPIPRGRIEIDG